MEEPPRPASLRPAQLPPRVHGAAGELLASRPARGLAALDPARLSQAEVDAGVAAAQVAVARVDPADPAAAAGPHADLGAVGVAVQGGSSARTFSQWPRLAGPRCGTSGPGRRCCVTSRSRRAVVVEVAARPGRGRRRAAAERRVGRRHVAELAACRRWRTAGCARRRSPRKAPGRRPGAAAAATTRPLTTARSSGAVEVEVGQDRAEAGAAPAAAGQAGRDGAVVERGRAAPASRACWSRRSGG